MSIFFKKARQISASILAVSVLATSFNLLAFAPAQAVDCPELGVNTRFKVPNYSAVYIVNKDHKRMYFPNGEVYGTWFSDYSGIVTLNPLCVDNYPSGGGINYRPGSRLVKTVLSPTVYAVGPNNTKHRLTNESTAVVLFGNDWPTKVRILSDAFDSNLKPGPDVEDIKSVNGQVVTIEDDPQVYFVSGGKLKKVIGSIPAFLSKDVQGIRQIMLESVPISAETTTAAEILADPTQMGGVGTTPVVPVVPVTPSNTLPSVGGNSVSVLSCKQVGKDIEIKRVETENPYILKTQCRDGGDGGLRDYTMTCTSNTKYYVSWKPCSSAPVQTVNQTDLISSVALNNSSGSGSFNLYTAVSYGSGVSYPWYPVEGTVPQTVDELKVIVTPKQSGNTTYAYVFSPVIDGVKPEFTAQGAQSLPGPGYADFTTETVIGIPLFNKRGNWFQMYVYARNNDGVSAVPNMPVEVDDIAVVRVYVPAKNTVPVVQDPYLIETLGVYSPNSQSLGYADSGYLRLKSYWAKQLLDIPSDLNSVSFQINRSVNAPAGNYTYAYIRFDSNTGSTNFDENLAKTALARAEFSTNLNSNLTITDYYRGKWVTVLAFIRNNDGISRVPNMPVEVDDVVAIHVKIPAKSVSNPYLSTAPTIVMPTANQVFVNKEYKVDVKFTTVPTSKSYELVVECYDCEAGNWTNTSQINLVHNDSGYVNTTVGPFTDGKSYRLRARPVFTDSVTAEYVNGAWSDYRYFSFKAAAPTPAVQGTKEISLSELNVLQPKTISFEDVGGEIITKYVSLYGVTIWSNNGKAIYVNDYNRGGAKASSGAYSISNNGTYPKTSYNDPLFLGFNTPVKAFGFYLVGNANFYGEQREVTITVTGPAGKVLGTYKKRVYESTTTYFGFQSDELIYKVDIDNGATYASEGIDDLMLVR